MGITPNYDLDIDTSLGGSNASDYVIPSQKAIKTYVDNNGGGGGASNLTDLGDVSITSAASGEALCYDGSKWINAPKTLVIIKDWTA